jgi:hypothetical protein
MIKCKCLSCSTEEVFENHKVAFMEGWDFGTDPSDMTCPKCAKSNSDEDEE